MAKKTYKDLRDGDIVYTVRDTEFFENRITIDKIEYPNMAEEDEKLNYLLQLYNDGDEHPISHYNKNFHPLL